MDCKCDKCRQACTIKPGWFKPGEVEQTAAHLGMTVEELFRTKLMVDWWGQGVEMDHNIYVLSPAMVGETPGDMAPFAPHGTCVFYKNGLCEIHAVKPYECRVSDHTTPTTKSAHLKTAQTWDTPEHTAQITKLLGHEAEAPQAGFADIFAMLDAHLGLMKKRY